MKTRLFTVFACVTALLMASFITAEEKKVDLKGVKCIMNAKAAAKADKSASFEGGKVYFCCGNCAKGFGKKSKTDELTRAKARAQLVATGQATNAKCPLAGRPAKVAVKVGGAEIKVCCNNCKGAVSKLTGDAQLLKVFSDAAAKKSGLKVAKK